MANEIYRANDVQLRQQIKAHLDEADGDIAALDIRVTQNESDIADLEAADVVHDERLDDLESAALPSLLLNGRFFLWDYGTSVAATDGSGVFVANRWLAKFTDASTSATLSRLDTYDGGATLTFTNTNADYFYFRQYIPSIQQFSGKTYTAVVDVETAESGLQYDFYIEARYNSDPAERVLVADTSQESLASSRQQITYTFTVPTLNPTLYTKDERNSLEFAFRIYAPTAKTGAVVKVHSISLNQGKSTLIPYCCASYEVPILAAFYETTNFAAYVGGLNTSSGQKRIFVPWKTRKRISPTVTVYDAANNAGKVSTYDLSGTRTDNVTPTAVSGDALGVQVVINSTTIAGIGARFIASAEWI